MSISPLDPPPAPAGYEPRRADRDDADRIETLINAATIADVGMPTFSEGEIARTWSENPDAPSQHHVVTDAGGEIRAVLWVEPEDDGLYCEMYVAGGDEEPLCRFMIETAEWRAAAESRPMTLTFNANGEPSRRLLEERGYERGVADHAMFMDLAGRRLEVFWPDGVELRPYREDSDDALMYRVMKSGFGDDWDDDDEPDAWIAKHRGAPGYSEDLWFFAASGDEIVGAIQCREQWHGAADTGWVKNLAVVPGARGHGVGKALLVEAFVRFQKRGKARAVLGVLDGNPARAFYERIGMHEGGSSSDHSKVFGPTNPGRPG